MRSKVEIQQKIEEGLVETALLKMEASFLLLRLQRIARESGAKVVKIKSPPLMVLIHRAWTHHKEHREA